MTNTLFLFKMVLLVNAPVAQLDRVSGFEPEGREFESLRARQDFFKKVRDIGV